MLQFTFVPKDIVTRGAKSGGTGEPGSQKVNWPAESLWGEVKILCSICKYYVSADNDVNING